MWNLQYIANLPASVLAGAVCAIPQKSVTQSAPPLLGALALDYAFFQRHVFSWIPSHLPPALREPQTLAAIGAGFVAAISVTAYFLTRNRPTAEEMERERRDMLARVGRITDGTIMDTMVGDAMIGEAASPAAGDVNERESAAPTPNIIVYNYRIAGVTYECAQDVTALAEQVRGIRSDLPIQVRYAPHNPGNSIVVADSWSGLRLTSTHPHGSEAHDDSAA